jgi:hypothetical protein
MNDYLTSKDLFLKEHSSKEKYEYYICTIAGVLFAYIGQTYTPHKLDSFFYVLIPFALWLLTLSFASGLMRIYISNDATKLNKNAAYNQECCVEISDQLDKNLSTYKTPAGNTLTREQLEKERADKNKLKEECEAQYQLRNITARGLGIERDVFLILGFLLILASKILQPYQ